MKNCSVIPYGLSDLKNRIFSDHENVWYQLKLELENKGFHVGTIDTVDVKTADVILALALPRKLLLKFWWLGVLHKVFYVAIEPPAVIDLNAPHRLVRLAQLLAGIFSIHDTVTLDKNCHKIHYPMPDKPRIIKAAPFSKRRLVTTVIGNKYSFCPNELYSERLKTIQYFSKSLESDFEFYGSGWSSEKFPNYGGMVEDKLATISNFNFVICYENQSNLPGYITEKIFDCFYAGAIPIYWGPENIHDYVPDTCYIDRRKFRNHEALHSYLSNFSEAEFVQRLSAIQEFLKSDQYRRFGYSHFIHQVVSVICAGNTDKAHSYRFSAKMLYRMLIILLPSGYNILHKFVKLKRKLLS